MTFEDSRCRVVPQIGNVLARSLLSSCAKMSGDCRFRGSERSQRGR